MQYRSLGTTGLRVSILGFGAATLGNEFGENDPGEGERALHAAVDKGINFFDVAPYYGRTLAETRLGHALKGRRHEVILATKCARYDVERFDFSAERVTRSIEESLARLQTDYVDIFHVHDVEFGSGAQIISETIPALRRIQQSGKARFIGITGLSLTMLRNIAAAAPVDCILSYCRYNLLNTDLDTILTPFAKQRGIGLISASPLHMRVLTDIGPPAWHPAPTVIREAGRLIAGLCRARGVNVSDIALQFAVRHPYVASTLNGFSNVREVEQNIKAIEQQPDPGLLREIAAVAAPVRGLMWPTGKPENYDPQMIPVTANA